MDPVLIPLTAIIFGIPAIALGARMVIKPVLDTWVKTREAKLPAPVDAARERARDQRMAEIESELAALRDEVERLSAVESFYKQLKAPSGAGANALPPGG